MADSDTFRNLRNALGTFTTGITVVTAQNQKNQPIGMTVNSFSSVSLDPPLILWSLSEESSYCDTFLHCQHFAVNVLSSDQMAISQLFASPENNKFANIDWQTGEHHLPLIDGAIAKFQCSVEHLHPGGDHTIIIGRVLEYDYSSSEPLVFNRGQYYTLNEGTGQ